MKKKFAIINLSLMMAVLFSILFQSVHSYEHLAKQLTEKKCHHKYHTGKTEFSHQHGETDHCFACEFTFSTFISPETYSFRIPILVQEVPYFFSFIELPFSFSGSSYSLRGPPFFIV